MLANAGARNSSKARRTALSAKARHRGTWHLLKLRASGFWLNINYTVSFQHQLYSIFSTSIIQYLFNINYTVSFQHQGLSLPVRNFCGLNGIWQELLRRTTGAVPRGCGMQCM